MTVIQANGEVASDLRIAPSANSFGKYQHYSQRYEPSRRRYPANVAVDDDQGDAEEVGDEGEAEADYEEVFYAGARANLRGRGGWRIGRSRYRSLFGRPCQHQPYASSEGTAQQGVSTRRIAQGPATLA